VHRKESKARSEYFEINTVLTERLAKRAKADGIKHFVFLSTMAVYGVRSGEINLSTPLKPYSLYGKSKLEAEKRLTVLEDDNFRLSIVRPPMVYGRGCKGNYNMLRKLALLPVFPKVDNKRSVIYSGNLCRFILGLLTEHREGIFMPTDSEPVSTSQLAEFIARANGHRLYLSELLGGFVTKLRLGVAQKAFGSLYYNNDTDSCVKYTDTEFAIMLTEGENNTK
jgi:UDP-glucose 4-epimerase